MRPVLFPLIIAVALVFALASVGAQAAPPGTPASGGAGAKKSATPAWPTWSRGFEAGYRSVGLYREETTAASDLPTGGSLLQFGAHVWYNHSFEAHAFLGFGTSTLMTTLGAGLRFNLFTFEEGPGLLSPIIKNFTLMLQLDYQHYTFPDTDTAVNPYTGSSWALQKGVGVQWYIGIPTNISRTFYFDLSLSTTNFGTGTYYMPYLGLGLELR